MLTLVNARTWQVIASGVQVASTRAERRRGLLHHEYLDPSVALVLSPCFAVHTAFMRFAIDVVFVDRAGFVVRIMPLLSPWRAAASTKAYAVIEFAGGALRDRDLRVGDRLYFAPVDVGSDRMLTLTSDFNAKTSLQTIASNSA